MKHPADQKTIDMLPEAPKKRGRPVTGKAMTPAERKRLSRQRVFCGEWLRDDAALFSAPVTELAVELSRAVSIGHRAMATRLLAEFQRRIDSCDSHEK